MDNLDKLQEFLLSPIDKTAYSTVVDCCLGWVAQHLQAFCILLATHCHHIVVIQLLSSNCCHPIAVLKLPLSSSSTLLLLAVAAASLPLPSPLPSLLLFLPSLLLLSSLTLLCWCCFVIVAVVVLLGSQSEELDQTTPQRHCPWHADGTPTLGLAARGPAALTQGNYVPDVVLLPAKCKWMTCLYLISLPDWLF